MKYDFRTVPEQSLVKLKEWIWSLPETPVLSGISIGANGELIIGSVAFNPRDLDAFFSEQDDLEESFLVYNHLGWRVCVYDEYNCHAIHYEVLPTQDEALIAKWNRQFKTLESLLP